MGASSARAAPEPAASASRGAPQPASEACDSLWVTPWEACSDNYPASLTTRGGDFGEIMWKGGWPCRAIIFVEARGRVVRNLLNIPCPIRRLPWTPLCPTVCPTALATPTQAPMDTFNATTWPASYVEWWFGDGAPGLHRDRAIRAAISRRGFDADLNVLASVSSQDFMEAVITARSLRHATFIQAILTIVRAWQAEQHSIATKQRAVRHLREHLDNYVVDDSGIPVVRIMVGDNNLGSQHVREALQPETDAHPLWDVYPAPADRQGDHVAVTGAAARFQSIAVGASFEDRGMRNDCHDAVAVVITTRTAHTRSLRHARFIRAILTIVQAWHREQHVF